MEEAPNSVMIYMQSIILLSLSYSFFTDFGWYSFGLTPSTGYYLSPLRSCVYSYTFSNRFQDDLEISLCQPTEDFTLHIIKGAKDTKHIEETSQEVKFLGRFLIAMSMVLLVVFMFELCSPRLNRLFRINLLVFIAALILTQFCFQMRMFAAMCDMAKSIFEKLDENKALVPESESKSELASHYGIGFYVCLFATCLYVVSFGFSMYKVVQLFLDSRDDQNGYSCSSKKQKGATKSMPRYITTSTKKGYEKIEDHSGSNAKYNLLITGSGSEHA